MNPITKQSFLILVLFALSFSFSLHSAYAIGGLSGALDDITKQMDSAGSGDQGTQTAPPPASPNPNPAQPPITGTEQPPLVPTKPGEGSITSIDPATGNMIQAVLNPDGSRTITEMDKSGKVTSSRTEPPRGSQPPSGSAYDPSTGVTTSVAGNQDGSRTITQTDSSGKVIESRTEPPRGQQRPSASAFDPSTGITTASVGNADGSRTITKTDSSGTVIETRTVPARK